MSRETLKEFLENGESNHPLLETTTSQSSRDVYLKIGRKRKMKVKGMTVQRLTSILQSYCHEGGSLDEVEIYDKEGNRVCSIEDIELKKGLDAEVCKITIHTRDIFDIEDYLKEKEKESQPREDYDNFHDGAGIGINSENFV